MFYIGIELKVSNSKYITKLISPILRRVIIIVPGNLVFAYIEFIRLNLSRV